MNNQEQITKLQGLLARIRRNAAATRGAAPSPATFEAPPAAPVAPAATRASYQPPAPTYQPPAPSYAPPAPSYAPPAPSYVPPAPSAESQSVDELLGVSASPPPEEVDVPLETLPPAAAAPTPEEEAIPLVSVATHESAPPPQPYDASFSLDSEVSEVRPTLMPRDSAPEVTVAAIEAEAEPITAEELSEEDLVDLTDGTPLPSTEVDIDFDVEREPVSSSRAASPQVETEHEVPIKTPPPESGPQEAPAVAYSAPPAPDVDALLGQELDIPTQGQVSRSVVPTPEQLGQTIELEEARGPALELAEARPSTTPPSAEELEVALPAREVATYDDSLLPPPEARDELEAHRRRLEEDIAPPPESLATLPSVHPGPAPEIVPVEAAPAPALEVSPEVIARATPEGTPETFASLREPFRPSTFVELLDASLSLGG